MKNIKKQSTWNLVKRFFEPFRFDKKLTIKALIPTILKSVLWGISLFLFKNITNHISDSTFLLNLNLFWIFFGIIICYYLIMVLSRNLASMTLWPVWRQWFYRKYMHRYVELNNNEVEKLGTGRLIAIADKGFHTHIDQCVKIIEDVIPNLIIIIISIFFVGFTNLTYMLFFIISIVVLGLVIYIQQKKAQQLRKKRNELNISIMRRFVKILMSKFEVLQSNKINGEVDDLVNSLEDNKIINFKQTRITIWIDIVLRLLTDGTKIGIILIFGFGLFTQKINIGEFASLMAIAYFLEKVLAQFSSYYLDFIKSYVEIEKLWDTFDNIPRDFDYKTGKEFVVGNGSFVLNNVSFSYGESKVFENFNIEIKGGTKNAFVGESGGGKSTLIKLLAGYVKPDKGEIIVDGQKLSEVKLIDYYKHIGYLTQDPSVFDGTIYENLVYGLDYKPEVVELHNIIKQAKCEFILEFEDGLETEIGERGVRLSGGQKQRLAIAKIMLKNPKIILLDEPTSALDSFNEELINIALHNLFKGKTVVIVAHRLQTVKQADRIVLFEQGKIIEEGNHENLVKLNGKYKKMLDLQSGF